MSNWFTLATWPLVAGAEVTWQHFEDIRRAIFILYSSLVPESTVPLVDTWQDNASYSIGGVAYNGYRASTVICHDGMNWVAPTNGTGYGTHATAAPHKTDWKGWYPCADSQKYYHHCKNSVYYIGGMTCSHSAEDDPDAHEWVCHASEKLPTQTWHLANCAHFDEWVSTTTYVAGQIVKVSDTTFERDGMICGYRCKVANTNQKPTALFPMTTMLTGSTYWEPYGDPVEVSSTGFISKNGGARYGYTYYAEQPERVSSSYIVNSGWPDQNATNYFHSDCGYQEYQAAIERVLDGTWVQNTDSEFYWGESNPKPTKANGNDWRFNCNKSGFELILKMMGKFSWYWDDQYPPTNISPSPSHSSQPCYWCSTHGGGYGCTDHPVWRRTWRYGNDGKAHLRPSTAFSESHKGTYPPILDADPTGYATSQIVLDHTQNLWHGNPTVEAVNDMKSALDLATMANWGFTADWANDEGTGFLAGIHDTGSAANAFAAILGACAWNGFGSGGGSGGSPRYFVSAMEVYCDGGGGTMHYEEDGITAKKEWPASLYVWNGWQADPVNAIASDWRLTVTVADPPRNARVGGGLLLASKGMGLNPDNGYPEEMGLVDAPWSCDGGLGSVTAWTKKDVTYVQYHDIHVPSGSGGTVVYTMMHPPDLGIAWQGEPSGWTELETAVTAVYGNWVIEVESVFYITIDRSFAII